MGITNNQVVNQLFNNSLIYDDNLIELIKKSLAFNNHPNKNDIIV